MPSSDPQPLYAQVAVPIPIADALTYRVPRAMRAVEPGCRVRVPVGRRELVGVVLALTAEEPPERWETRDLGAVLDLQPVLSRELLDLAAFIAEYYLAPVGEVPRMMLPGSLPPWGDRRVSLTNAGALAPPRSAAEQRLVETLLENRRLRLADLQKELGLPGLGALVEELRQLGRLSVEEPGERRGTRYVMAVELNSSADLGTQLAACGRSPRGRAVVEYLHALGRPATLREVTSAVGCGTSVVRRLVKLRILRRFSQPERLSLGRHRLTSGSGSREEIELRDDQEAAVKALEEALEAGGFAPFLLRGMTGSGKTEVYLRAIGKARELGKSAAVLVPEIALVPALARRAADRFGRDLAILHSNLSRAEREQEWERLRRREARIVLGPRSALFAPLSGLGLVIVDEEHDGSYKQDKVPRYNGRDLALWRARAAGAAEPRESPQRSSRQAAAPRAHRPGGPRRAARGHPRGPAPGAHRAAPWRGSFLFSPAPRDRDGGSRRRPDHPPAQPPRLLADSSVPRLR